MSRRRRPRTQDHLLARFTDAVNALTTQMAEQRRSPDPIVTPELVPVRLLGVQHLGRWVLLKGRPSTRDEQAEPSILDEAGVLVGYRAGSPGRGSEPAKRVLVLQQGAEQRATYVRVDAPAVVYPRRP